MADKKVRGTRTEHEMNEEYLARDTRPLARKVLDNLKDKTAMTITLFVIAAAAFMVPAASNILLVIAVGLAMYGMSHPDQCPIKMPIQANSLDPNEPPMGKKPSMASGIFYLGNEMRSGHEVWLTNDDCRQHFLILGTTGSGKTELLIGFCANALSWASGFLIVDGKGDVNVFAKIYMLARKFGREDDLLVLNFMTGDRPDGAGDGSILSNTMNPFSTGSSDSLTQMVVSLMDDSGSEGGMWKGRATAMFTGVMRALATLRDKGIIDLNVAEIRDHLNLKKIIDLADAEKYPMIPQSIRKSISSYLTSLPGYVAEKGYKQAQTTLDQHGYLEMQFTKILGSLADVYNHIFATPYGEVDMTDVVLNRRILIVMLPALEKSADEVANLGKIVVASLKRMMGFTLGNKIEGNFEEIVKKRLSNAPSPFVSIMDEVGYYCVDGMDLMAAQARSLGFSMTYAAQDINGMKRLNDKIVGSIIGNTNTKIIMRIEDPETAKMATELAGKAYRPTVAGYTGQAGEVHTSYADNMEARFEEVDRIKFLDMKAQEAGQMHIVYKEVIVRAKSFYANPAATLNVKKLKLRANHFIKIKKPKHEELVSASKLPQILELLAGPQGAEFSKRASAQADAQTKDMRGKPARDEIALAAKGFEGYRQAMPSQGAHTAACAAIANLATVMLRGADALTMRAPGSTAPASPDDFAQPATAKAPREPAAAFTGELGRARAVQEGRAGGLPNVFAGDDVDLDFGPPSRDDRPPPPRGDKFEDQFNAFDEPGERRPVRPTRVTPPEDLAALGRAQRRPSPMRADVEHSLDVSGRSMDDKAADENDVVFRLLADLDYDPVKTNEAAVAERIENATGAPSSLNADEAPPEALDYVAWEADAAMAEPPAPDMEPEPPMGEPPPPDAAEFADASPPRSHLDEIAEAEGDDMGFMSEILEDLLEDGGKA